MNLQDTYIKFKVLKNIIFTFNQTLILCYVPDNLSMYNKVNTCTQYKYETGSPYTKMTNNCQSKNIYLCLIYTLDSFPDM